MHAPIPDTGISSYILSADSLITAPGIGLFIMVSGALLLPINTSTKLYMKKRIGKIVWPTMVWTVFYMLLLIYENKISYDDILIGILSVPFSPQYNGVLWFMYMLTGIYLIAPILSAWLKKAENKEVLFYLYLWAITLCYPLIRDYVFLDESKTGILYYLGGYAGYFLLGYYLNNYAKDLSSLKCGLLIILPLLVATLLKVNNIHVDFYDVFWYLSIFVAVMSVAWFMIIKKINIEFNQLSKFHNFIALLSNCCFGIYLVHIFVMRTVLWRLPVLHGLNGILQILVITILTFGGSFLITWFISLMPKSEYIIGFNQKK